MLMWSHRPCLTWRTLLTTILSKELCLGRSLTSSLFKKAILILMSLTVVFLTESKKLLMELQLKLIILHCLQTSKPWSLAPQTKQFWVNTTSNWQFSWRNLKALRLTLWVQFSPQLCSILLKLNLSLNISLTKGATNQSTLTLKCLPSSRSQNCMISEEHLFKPSTHSTKMLKAFCNYMNLNGILCGMKFTAIPKTAM